VAPDGAGIINNKNNIFLFKGQGTPWEVKGHKGATGCRMVRRPFKNAKQKHYEPHWAYIVLVYFTSFLQFVFSNKSYGMNIELIHIYINEYVRCKRNFNTSHSHLNDIESEALHLASILQQRLIEFTEHQNARIQNELGINSI
jgi:hypothetical protein